MRIKIIIFLLLVAAFSKFCLYETKETRLQITEDANIRAEPTIESTVLKVANTGSTYQGEKLKDNQNWYKIQFDKNETGYIHESLVEEKDYTSHHVSKNRVSFILTIVFIVLLLKKGLNVIKKGKQTKCPQCKKWFAEKVEKISLLSKDGSYKTKTVTDITKNKRGEVKETTEREVQVHMTTEYYRHYCSCKKCNYKWYYDTKHTFEG